MNKIEVVISAWNYLNISFTGIFGNILHLVKQNILLNPHMDIPGNKQSCLEVTPGVYTEQWTRRKVWWVKIKFILKLLILTVKSMNMKAKIMEIGNWLIIGHCLELYTGTFFFILLKITSEINYNVMTVIQNITLPWKDFMF